MVPALVCRSPIARHPASSAIAPCATSARLSSLLLSFSIVMRSFVFLGLSAVVAAALPSPFEPGAVKPSPKTDGRWTDVAPEITTVSEHSEYAVKLDCVGCPFPVWKNHMTAEWQHPPQNNSLVCLSFLRDMIQ